MPQSNYREKLPPRVSDFQARTKRRRRKIFFLCSVVFISFLFFIFWWVVFNSDLLHFKSIEISGNTRLTDQEVSEILEKEIIESNFWRNSLGNSHFFSWPSKIDQKKINNFGNIRKVVFLKDYWNRRLKIFIEERKFLGIICNRKQDQTQCFWFDREGFIFEDAFFPEGFLVWHVDDYSRSKVGLGEYIFPVEDLANVFKIFEAMNSLGLSANLWEIREGASREIQVNIDNGPIVYLQLDSFPDYITRFLRFLIDKKGIGNLVYVDFRTSGRVYFKDRSE